MTWAIPGPGAKRGIDWLLFQDDKVPPCNWVDYREEMRDLLKDSQRPGRLSKSMRPLEMRDVEHACCEWDKYLRIRIKGGRLRAKYHPALAE
jgi:hypothetical protein